jgi:hypothetical protein
LTRHYLNAQYRDPRARGHLIEGTDLWVSATVKRGTRPTPPTLVWYAERAAAGGDLVFPEDHFIPDPTFDLTADDPTADLRWAKVTVPAVTGLTWRFRVRRTKVGKPDKLIRVKGEVETWKRFFLDVKADDEGLYALYREALPHIKRAFEYANIEVVENRVQVADAYKRGKGTDKSVKDGRRLGTLYEVNMHQPEMDELSQDLTITLDDGATNCGAFATIEGNDLVITLNEGAVWKPQPVSSLTATANGATIATFAYYGRLDDHRGEGWARPLANETLEVVCERVSDRVVRVHLDHERLSNRYTRDTQAWDVPRVPTALGAYQAGPLALELTLKYTLRGAQGGLNFGGGVRFATYIGANALKVACVLCHEFAHGCGLVRQDFHRRHAGAQIVYDTATPRRAHTNVAVANPTYYDADFGGSGTHCNLGAQAVASCVTRARQTYTPNGVLCLMYHASVIGPDGAPRSNGVRFCEPCVRQLRGIT